MNNTIQYNLASPTFFFFFQFKLVYNMERFFLLLIISHPATCPRVDVNDITGLWSLKVVKGDGKKKKKTMIIDGWKIQRDIRILYECARDM